MSGTLKRQETARDVILDPVARLNKLKEHGSLVAIDKSVPVRRYLRSGSEMERQARVYYSEGQWDRAFMLYHKFATLFIEKLPKHPEYSKASPAEKNRMRKLLKEAALPRAMDLKEKLQVKYEKEKDELEKQLQEEAESTARRAREEEMERQAQLQQQQQQQQQQVEQAEQVAKFLQGEGGVVTTSQPGDQGGPSGDVVMVKEKELSKESEGVRYLPGPTPDLVEVQPPGQDPGSAAEHSGSRDSPIEIDHAAVTTPREDLTSTDPGLAQVLPSAPATAMVGASVITPYQERPSLTTPYQVQPAGSLLAQPPPVESQQVTPFPSAPPLPQAGGSGNYTPYQPTIPPNVSAYHQGPPPNYNSYQQQVTPTPYSPMVVSPATPPVALSPALQQPTYEKSIFQAPFANTSMATPTTGTTDWTSPVQAATPTGPPMVDRSTKPDSLKALSTDCWTAGVDGYRPLFIPMDTAAKFEAVAITNTRRNVETCGILAGKLSQNTLRITHVIVPKQKGKSDSCEMLSEEDLFDVQDQYDLITLGWIHTHPTQTAFMSSVDLHNHCSYQVMMDEAVAIVVAPKYKQTGYYTLTEPHGLNYITHCEEEGFHVHPKEPPLYEDCKHIRHDQNTFIQIIDLR